MLLIETQVNLLERTVFRRKLWVAVSVLLMCGCGSNPYVRTPGMDASLPGATTATTSIFAGGLEQAIKDVDTQRAAYHKVLENRTDQRNILSGALIGLSAGALYKGITSSAGAGSRAVVNLGAAAGGAYALGSYSNSPSTELAYITAANDLTCLVLRTRPWLVKQTEFNTFTASVTALMTATNELDRLFQKQAAQSGDSRKFVATHNFEKLILYKARVTLRKASNFKGFVDTAGFQLRQEAVLVSNAANFEIHRLQPELAKPSTVLAGLRSTSQAFRDIKPLDVPPPETQKNEDDKNAGGDTADELAKTPAADEKQAADKSIPNATPTAASASGKAADKLEKQVADQAKLLAAQEKTNDKRDKKTAAKLKDLTAELKSLMFVVTALKDSKTATITTVVSKLDTAAAENLATALSDVLAAMRPVNAVLTRAYSLRPYVKNIPECQPLNAQVFEFSFDSDETTLNPGQTFDVAVKGGAGVPRIWLSGAKSNAKGEEPKLTTTIDGGVARAKLTLPLDTPAGDIYIMAMDGSGKQKDSIKVTVVVPPIKK